ncbi:MAG: hypothetical protein M3014_11930 [Chloroflexota bacterium]|nr:hypothetical protein [Chloroflexota bacterium]
MPYPYLPSLEQFPPLLPQFLRKRRAGLPAASELIPRLHLDRQTFFTLVTLHQLQGSYSGEPVTRSQINLYNPYATNDIYSQPITILLDKELLSQDSDGGLLLTPYAHDQIERLHSSARSYLAGLSPLAYDEMQELAHTLSSIVDLIVDNPVLSPCRGSHLASSRSLDSFGGDAPPLVRIEQAVHDLWMARDDAHMHAWRKADMPGPAMPVLNLLYAGGVPTVSALADMLTSDQRPESIRSNMAFLIDQSYVVRNSDEIALTPAGRLIRDNIESETNRIYFTPWPETSEGNVVQLCRALNTLTRNLPTPFDRALSASKPDRTA